MGVSQARSENRDPSHPARISTSDKLKKSGGTANTSLCLLSMYRYAAEVFETSIKQINLSHN
jgi:hypothetical protein